MTLMSTAIGAPRYEDHRARADRSVDARLEVTTGSTAIQNIQSPLSIFHS
jgi:hypothetical protein